MAVNLDPDLLSILVCPKCRSEFRVDDEANELICTNAACALAYPVRDDIPVLLIDEARDTRAESESASS
ncbi:Trm112 family protein [Kribbella sp. NPDC004138]|uniref:Trm112 family protein n=1 Tax=Kribbella sp. NPDC051936 TaxID=3154946 RepID=UPI002FAD2673